MATADTIKALQDAEKLADLHQTELGLAKQIQELSNQKVALISELRANDWSFRAIGEELDEPASTISEIYYRPRRSVNTTKKAPAKAKAKTPTKAKAKA